MTLPTAGALAASIAQMQHALSILEAGFAVKSFTASSGGVTVIATGDVSVSSIAIAGAAASLSAPDLSTLVSSVAGHALAQAIASSATASAAAAAADSLPGLPNASFPPPPDAGFDVAVSKAMAVAPGIEESLRGMLFEGRQAAAHAVVTGALEMRAVDFTTPLPTLDALAAATTTAINIALGNAKNVFGALVSAPVDIITAPGPRATLPDFRLKALLVVENAATLRASDALLRSRLSALGFDVEVRKAPSAVSADANGRALIVVSESVQPADVAAKFTNSAVPIVAMEPGQFRDLKMTGGTDGTDEGEAAAQKQLQLTAGHPLAAGLSGLVTIATASVKLEWGKPAAAAVKIGAIVGKTNEWGIFAYDTGDAMVGLNAPARRVGFFAGQDTPAALTAEGWRLFDAAVHWATAAKGLLTVGMGPLSPADAAIKKRLEERHGLEVLVRTAKDTRTNDLGDLKLHVISGSAPAADVGARFVASPAPTLNCVAALHDDFKMTGTTANKDFGTVSGKAVVDILAPSHPLAAGLTGRVTVVSPAQTLGWGQPGAEAVKIAALADLPSDAGIFAYESGANMIDIRAPAPRIGFFSEGADAAVLTTAGLALFDAAAHWARRPRALLVVGSLSLVPGDEAIRARLERIFGFVVDVRTAKDAIDKQATGKRLIVIAESSLPADVGSRLTSLATPVLAMQPALFDDLKMTGTTANIDFGESSGQTDIDVAKADHPLAAGLPIGRLTVATAAAKFGWGKPATGAIKIARVVGKTDQWTIFGYETGTAMIGANAPARRVGWFAERDAFAALNNTGLRLFDAAVLWTAGRLDVVPEGAGLPDVIRGGGQPTSIPLWQVGVSYRVGDQVVFNGAVYRCRQAHTSQSDWQPPQVFALWERVDTSGVWMVQVIYKVGDEVTFQSHRYRCIQGHQAQSDWQPPAVPTLWQLIS